MKDFRQWTGIAAAVGLLAISSVGCNDINSESTPVELIATVDQDVDLIDVQNLPTGDLGIIFLRAIAKRTDATDLRFLDVLLRSYRVSYVRTDGGTRVPAAFSRSVSGLIPVNGSSTATNGFAVFDIGAINQAPFASLLKFNGGVDPETGQRFIKMDVIMDIFGETLSGSRVSTRVRFPITFCGGCTIAG